MLDLRVELTASGLKAGHPAILGGEYAPPNTVPHDVGTSSYLRVASDGVSYIDLMYITVVVTDWNKVIRCIYAQSMNT